MTSFSLQLYKKKMDTFSNNIMNRYLLRQLIDCRNDFYIHIDSQYKQF